MKTPLCEFCLQTRELCGGCSNKLKTGQMREAEVMLSRLLAKHKERMGLEKVQFTRAYDCGNIIYLFTSTSPALLIGRGGKAISTIIREAGKHIRIVKENNEFNILAEEILQPVKLLHVNSVFHDGKEVAKLVVPKNLFGKLPCKVPELEKLLSTLAGKQVKMAFE